MNLKYEADDLRDDQLKFIFRGGSQYAIKLADAIDAMRAERNALKADAERYRWLRQYGNGIYPDVFNDEGAPILAVPAAAVRLDSAIDAAMRDQTP